MTNICVSAGLPLSLRNQAKMIAEVNNFRYEENILKCDKGSKIIYLDNLSAISLSRIAWFRNEIAVFYTVSEGIVTVKPSIWINGIKYIATPSYYSAKNFRDAGIRIDMVIPHGIRIPSSVKSTAEKKGYFYRSYYQKRKFPEYGIEFLKNAQSNYNDIDIYLNGYQLDKGFLQRTGIKAVINGVVSESKLAELYNSHMFYLNLADNEGFGLTPLEAMSYGEVVLTPEYPSILEYLPKECNITIPVYYKTYEAVMYEKIEHFVYKPDDYYNAFLKSREIDIETLERMSRCNIEKAKEYDYKKVYKKFEELVI